MVVCQPNDLLGGINVYCKWVTLKNVRNMLVVLLCVEDDVSCYSHH